MRNEKKILVTGGAGFIGSHLAKEACNFYRRIIILDDFSTGKEDNLLPLPKNITVMQGDINDDKIVKEALKNVEVVFHQAALPSVQRSIKNPCKTNLVNVNGTLNMLRFAVEAGAQTFIFASSSSIYGKNKQLPMKESANPDPQSPYAVSKLAGEYYCKVFSGLGLINTVSLRYFNVFGPRQDPNAEYAAVVPKFISSMLKGESPTIYGNGKQSRDFTFIKNVVEANFLAANYADKFSGRVINVGCGDSVSVYELFNTASKILGFTGKPVYTDSRPGEILDSCADNTALKKLGLRKMISFYEGLEKTITWFRDFMEG